MADAMNGEEDLVDYEEEDDAVAPAVVDAAGVKADGADGGAKDAADRNKK